MSFLKNLFTTSVKNTDINSFAKQRRLQTAEITGYNHNPYEVVKKENTEKRACVLSGSRFSKKQQGQVVIGLFDVSYEEPIFLGVASDE